MKKLSLVISSLCLFFWVSACKNAQNTQSETKTSVNGISVGGSTQSTTNQTSHPETVGNGAGIKKDSTTSTTTGNAITHPVPNQDKIDSLKAKKKKEEYK